MGVLGLLHRLRVSKDSAVEVLEQRCVESGLVLPPLPMSGRLRVLGPWLFSTRRCVFDPYDWSRFHAELEKTPDDYLILGQAGRGFQSQIWFYYLHWGPFSFFLQHAFRGVYADLEEERENICMLLDNLAKLFHARQEIESKLQGSRILIVQDAWRKHRCGWSIVSRIPPLTPAHWHGVPAPLQDVFDMFRRSELGAPSMPRPQAKSCDANTGLVENHVANTQQRKPLHQEPRMHAGR